MRKRGADPRFADLDGRRNLVLLDLASLFSREQTLLTHYLRARACFEHEECNQARETQRRAMRSFSWRLARASAEIDRIRLVAYKLGINGIADSMSTDAAVAMDDLKRDDEARRLNR